MIDSTKLLPRKTLDKSVLSEKTIANIVIIKKDVKKIDNLLETKLILSKERQRIANRRAEQLRRRQEEENLEKTDDENLDVDITRDPKTPRRGGLLTALFAGLIGGIGFLVIKSIPLFKKIGSILTTIASPFIRLFNSIGKLVNSVVKKLKPETDKLSDALQKGGDDVKKLPNLLERVGNDILRLAGVVLANSVISAIFSGVATSKVTKALNAARSQRLMTPPQANAIQKAIKQQKVNEIVTEPSIKRTGANIVEIVQEGDIATAFKESRKIQKKYVTESKKVAVATVEDAAEAVQSGRVGKKISKEISEQLEFSLSGSGTSGRISGGSQLNIFTQAKPGEIEAADKLIKKFGDEDILAQNFRLTKDISPVMEELDLIEREALENVNLRKIIESESGTRIRDFIPGEQPTTRFGVPGGQIGPDFPSVAAKKQRFFFGKGSATGANPFTGAPTFKVNPKGRTIDPTTGGFFAKRSTKAGADALLDATKTVAGRQTLKSLGFISKNVIRQSLGAVPLLGDLAVLLLDIYVFGEIPARAGFKTIGSIVGSIVGGIVGSLIAPPVGTVVGAIIGGIGGDILGAVTFDFLESRTDYGIYGPPDQKRFSQKDVTKAVIGGTTKGLTVKDLGGKFEVGQKIVNKGDGTEFIIDSNSYSALNKFAPGAIEALNAGDGGFDTIKSLMSKLPYERGTKTKVFPVPIPSGGGKMAVSNEGESNFVNFESEGGLGSFLAMVTQNKYKR